MRKGMSRAAGMPQLASSVHHSQPHSTTIPRCIFAGLPWPTCVTSCQKTLPHSSFFTGTTSFSIFAKLQGDSKHIHHQKQQARLQHALCAQLLQAEAPSLVSEDETMTVTAGISISNNQLIIKGNKILTQVPDNVTLTPSTGLDAVQGAFLGASSPNAKSHHVFTLGVLKDLRLLCCFRFSLWWMTQRMGTSAKDIPLETQFLLLESKDGSSVTLGDDDNEEPETLYTVFLPLIDGSFRTSLQGNDNDELQFCLESGDIAVKANGGLHCVFLHTGTNPFDVIAEAVQSVEMHMQTFQRREAKKVPGIIDWFGWCTWDAFYTDVSADGVRQGLKSLSEGGTPARFLIIDDGWQSVVSDNDQLSGEATAGTQLAKRLTNIKENHKFQKDGKDGERQEDPALGLQHVVCEMKDTFDLKYVYVWHAITGYWGGIKPGVAEMDHYETALAYPTHSPGVLYNQPNMNVDSLTVNGLGLAHPNKVFQFYNELHSYLAAAGVDGVKVDVQNILETLGTGFGGRVSLTRHYHQALEKSIARNFPDNGCIACMSHNTDGLYSIKQTAIVRASDDFWPRDPASHTIHIASVAYNSFFLAEFMQPDWDMFQSLHPAAAYHAAARAIGGCPLYVSDKPGNHDFDLLKKLVLPDGSILRAQLPGRPTRDCLFTDPARDGKSLLKIWNMNRHTGVLGAFNCQGAGWCKVDKKNLIHDADPESVSGSVRAKDVDFLEKLAPKGWTGECALYSHRGGELVCLPKNAILPVTLEVLEFELYTVSPMKRLNSCAAFAPLGLLEMFNSGGAIYELEYQSHEDHEKGCNSTVKNGCNGTVMPSASIKMAVHGSGKFGAYSSIEPKECLVNNVTTDVTYDPKTGLLTFAVPEVDGLFQDVVIKV